MIMALHLQRWLEVFDIGHPSRKSPRSIRGSSDGFKETTTRRRAFVGSMTTERFGIAEKLLRTLTKHRVGSGAQFHSDSMTPPFLRNSRALSGNRDVSREMTNTSSP